MGALADKLKTRKRDLDILADQEATRKRIDLTEGMSTKDKVLAGIGQGMTNVALQAGNILGIVDDEDMAAAKLRDEDLLGTKAGGIGSFVGETAMMLPLSLAGGAAATAAGRGVRALQSAKSLPRAVKALTTVLPRASGAGVHGALRAGVEGAAAGALLAGPDKRLEGAQSGAMWGAGLNKTFGSLGRKFVKGMHKKPAMTALQKEVKELTGRNISVPVGQGASGGGISDTGAKFAYKSGLSMFPLARGGSKKMANKMHLDWEGAILTKTFGKKHAKAILKKLKETDSFTETAEWALKELKGYPGNRRAIREVIKSMTKSDPLDPRKLDKIAQRIADGDSRPFYSLTSNYLDLMGETLEESTVSGRRFYNQAMNNWGPMAQGAGVVGLMTSLPAYLGLTGATRGLASGPAQRFMMGDSVMNKTADAVGKFASPYAAAIRNRVAGGE